MEWSFNAVRVDSCLNLFQYIRWGKLFDNTVFLICLSQNSKNGTVLERNGFLVCDAELSYEFLRLFGVFF